MRKLCMCMLMILSFLLTGCVHVFTDIDLNRDMSGTWKSEIFPEMNISEQDARQSLDKVGIKDYTLRPIQKSFTDSQGNSREINGFEFKKKFDNDLDLLQLVNQLAAATSGTIPHREKILQRSTEDEDIYTFDMGRSTERTTITVPGTIIEDSVGEGTLKSSNKIEYTSGQRIHFRFEKSSIFMVIFKWILIICGLILLLGAGLIFYLRRKQSLTVPIVAPDTEALNEIIVDEPDNIDMEEAKQDNKQEEILSPESESPESTETTPESNSHVEKQD